MYKFDPYKLAVQLLPQLLYSPLVLAMLKAFCCYIQNIAKNFTELRKGNQTDLNLVPTVLMLEEILNRTFHLEENQIKVTSIEHTGDVYLYWISGDAYMFDHPYFYLEEESQPVYLTKETEPPLGNDITIQIPNFLASSQNVNEDVFGGVNLSIIRQVIDKYKPAGKNCTIEVYTYE